MAVLEPSVTFYLIAAHAAGELRAGFRSESEGIRLRFSDEQPERVMTDSVLRVQNVRCCSQRSSGIVLRRSAQSVMLNRWPLLILAHPRVFSARKKPFLADL